MSFSSRRSYFFAAVVNLCTSLIRCIIFLNVRCGDTRSMFTIMADMLENGQHGPLPVSILCYNLPCIDYIVYKPSFFLFC